LIRVLSAILIFGSYCAVQSQRAVRSQFARSIGERTDLQQKVSQAIKAGEPLTQKIGGGESQTFSVSLTAGQYAEFVVEQHGNILLATLFDPQGNQFIQMDNPAGGYGPIYFSSLASSSGDYRLEVRAVDKWALAANYEVLLSKLRSAENTDQLLIDAELSFAQGRKSLSAGNRSAAIDFYQRALNYWQVSNDIRWQAVSQYALSETYRNLDIQRSEACLKETLRILEIEMAATDWRLKASALNDLGVIYSATGRSEEALKLLDQALSMYAMNRDPRGQASALGNIGRMRAREGNLSLALEFINRALVFRREAHDEPGELNLLNGLAFYSDQIGEPDRALDYSKEALRGWERIGESRPQDRKAVAEVLNNVAAASDKLGKWDEALDYYARALDKYDKNDPLRAPTLDNKGELYASLGNLQKAKECYEEALKLLSGEKSDLDNKASLLVHMGQLSLIQGEVANALHSFEQARSLGPPASRLGYVLTNLGAALMLSGRPEEGKQSYEQALEIQIKLKDRRGQALTLQKRGEVRAQFGERTEALADLNQALSLWRSVKDRVGEASTLEDIARANRDSGSAIAAQANSREAIGIIEMLRTNISSRLLRTSYFASREDYYELDIDLNMQPGKSEKSEARLAAALESAEKARARVLLEALSEARLGRAENSQSSDVGLAKTIEALDTLSHKLEAKLWARTRLLNAAHSAEQIALLDKDIGDINAEYDLLEAQIRSQNPRFNALVKPRPSPAKEIQQQLDANTVLLEYSLGDRHSYVWAVTPDSIKGFELPPRSEIESVAKKLTQALAERNRSVKNETGQQWQRRQGQAEADYVQASTTLSKMVLEPVLPLVGSKRLVIVADGALQSVSFGALPEPLSRGATPPRTKEKQEYNRFGSAIPILIDSHEIIYEPSASVIALQRRELSNRPLALHAVAVLANPVFDNDDPRVKSAAAIRRNNPVTNPAPTQNSTSLTRGSDVSRALDDAGIMRLEPLPFSQAEAESILSVAPKGEGMAALNFKASRATATSPALSQYRIVHFATHGIVDFQRPELSGIVLSMVNENGEPEDGYLRLRDIYDLTLPTELVVLSGCQTGIGKEIKGEGLIALTRGFMYAGSRSVVATLWKVDDAATAQFMAEFYKQIFTNGQRPAAALRAAQLKLAGKRSPADWAGFVLQGEWK
jgi:CHAT domain-containing protein/Tfp pilus assembly protein PilF